MARYFVWRLDSSEKYRAYGTRNHFEPGCNDGGCIWRGESWQQAQAMAREANEWEKSNCFSAAEVRAREFEHKCSGWSEKLAEARHEILELKARLALTMKVVEAAKMNSACSEKDGIRLPTLETAEALYEALTAFNADSGKFSVKI